MKLNTQILSCQWRLMRTGRIVACWRRRAWCRNFCSTRHVTRSKNQLGQLVSLSEMSTAPATLH